MTKEKESRNEKILELYRAGLTVPRIHDELVRLNYEISQFGIWRIIRNSPDYTPRNKIKKFCNFCLENKEVQNMYHGKTKTNHLVFRMCPDCLKRLMPEQPIEE